MTALIVTDPKTETRFVIYTASDGTQRKERIRDLPRDDGSQLPMPNPAQNHHHDCPF